MADIWSFLLQTLTASGVAALLLLVKAMFRDKLPPRWQFAVWSILGVVVLLPGLEPEGVPLPSVLGLVSVPQPVSAPSRRAVDRTPARNFFMFILLFVSCRPVVQAARCPYRKHTCSRAQEDYKRYSGKLQGRGHVNFHKFPAGWGG